MILIIGVQNVHNNKHLTALMASPSFSTRITKCYSVASCLRLAKDSEVYPLQSRLIAAA